MEERYSSPQLLIGGEFIDVGTRDSQDVENPATGEALGSVPHCTPADLDRALTAAERSFLPWKATSPIVRGRILRRASDLIRERSEAIARLITLEVGKPLAEARVEVTMAADGLEWFAEEGRRAYGRVIPAGTAAVRFMVVKEPVGPIASFAPWNFPVDNAARKIASALAAGCTCIHKPAEEAPASALAVARALVDAGLPAGVLAIVFGVPSEISEYLIASPVIRKISFTGSVPVGKHLMKLAAQSGKRTTMELGGHAPVLVCEDVDVDAVLDIAMVSKFRNAGQVCVAPTRFYVHETIHRRFVEGFAKRAKALPVGNGLEEETRMGPMAHARRREGIRALVQEARRAGAEVAAGGSPIDGPGHFYQPTVIANVPETARIMNEEPFGPVALVNSFRDFDDAIRRANRLPFGLAAYGFSNDARTVTRIGDSLEAGMVAINSFAIATTATPFLGVKESGHGAENGMEGLEACLVTKVISIA